MRGRDAADETGTIGGAGDARDRSAGVSGSSSTTCAHANRRIVHHVFVSLPPASPALSVITDTMIAAEPARDTFAAYL